MERRKDMWKLLYSLVNRNEAELNDVCTFIDEILCKESSLLKQSLNGNINRFQDTFILWLVHKLLKSLDFNTKRSVQENCVMIQCKLLNSCLVNRPPLFEQLSLAYIHAIEQLIDAYVKENILSNTEIYLDINAFTTEDCYLKEIDANFQLPHLQVAISRIDDFTQILLQILYHAMSMGYENYPDIYNDSLIVIFKVLKECDMTTKLLCLKYLNTVFGHVVTLNETLEVIYELCLRTFTIMWEQMSLWLEHNCFSMDNYDAAIDETCSLLKVLQTFQTQLNHPKLILKHSFVLLQHLLEVHNIPMANCKVEPNVTIMDATINYIYSLINTHKELKVDLAMDKCLLICRIAEICPNAIRLMPSIVELKFPGKEAALLMQFIYKRFEMYANKNYCSVDDTKILIESLASIVQLEHILFYKEQVKYVTTNDWKEENMPYNIPVKQLLQIVGLNGQELFNCLVKIVTKLKQISLNVITGDTVKLAGLLLKSSLMYNILNHNFVNELLDIIMKPIKNYSKYIKENSVSIASLQALSILDFKISTETMNNISLSMIAMANYVYSESSAYNLRQKFLNCLQHLLIIGWCKADLIMQELKSTILNNCDIFCVILKTETCANINGMCLMAQNFTGTSKICDVELFDWFQMTILCNKCQPAKASKDFLEDYLKKHTALIKPLKVETNRKILPLYSDLKSHLLKEFLFKMEYSFIGNHLNDVKFILDDCYKLITMNINIYEIHLPTFGSILMAFLQENRTDFLKDIIPILYKQTIECLQMSQNEDKQEKLLKLFTRCTETHLLSENFLFQFFKLTCFFLIHPESKVVNEAIVCAIEMCIEYKILPIQLWNWYKREAMTLIIRLAIYVYLAKGIRLTRSLRAFTTMLGFSCVQEFICKYYRLIVTLIVPYCIKEPRCKGLIINISKMTSKKIDRLLALSFLRIYSHVYFMEETNIRNACIDLIIKCTGSTVSRLMNNDIKQTVSEFLVYYNRQPEFVMQAFQNLLPQNSVSIVKTNNASSIFANFIADRFLGVITYFQTCLAEPNFEKSLKEETLLSLGEIMRTIGSENVTQFRFKIIAMLSFVLTLNDNNLKNICLQIWNIFFHTVNVEKLGPLLSGIVATLQPLLDANPDYVNNIYEFLILKNDVLLGMFIPNLYFMENMQNVKPAIKDYVKRQYDIYICEHKSFFDKLGFLHKQIINENITVRIYGFKCIRELINEHRDEVNHLILDVIGERDTLLEQVINAFVNGCGHIDRNVQLAAAKCLGELGAVDPSYLFSNYSFENCPELCLSIHTDDFAVWALTELCRAYQYQKDTKYVDNFSLAIQETLSAFGVSPRENKKLNIWQGVPQRMRQIMEPLLNSCYTNSKREFKNTEHPLFLSDALINHEDWSFAWACRLIELIQDVDTSHLLNSYKPSFRRDNKTLVLFFPYILLHALQECNKTEMERIYEEFHAVFNNSSQNEETSSIQALGESNANHVIYKEFPLMRYSTDSGKLNDIIKHDLAFSGGLGAEERGADGGVVGIISKKWETCTKFCSEQIDFLQRWLREWLRLNLVGGKMPDSNQAFMAIKNFLEKFNKLEISKANYNARDYMRSLLYLEEYIESNKFELQEQLSFLLEIHGKLMDADSVEGAVYLKKVNLTLAEEILVNRLLDRPQETIICYEQLLSNNEITNITQDDIKNMIDSYLCMDISATALLTIDGLWKKLSDQYTDDYFKECKSEILWRLGRFDELEELLEDSIVKDKLDNWNIQCAEAFLLFRKSAVTSVLMDYDKFSQQLDNIRSNVLFNMKYCVGMAENSYNLCYDEILRLHLLDEMEKQNKLINTIIHCAKQCNRNKMEDVELLKQKCFHEIQEIFNNWFVRLNVLPPMSSIMEIVFCFRRNLLQESQHMLKQYEDLNEDVLKCVEECVNEEIGRLWLSSAQMYRDNGCLQQAHLSLLKAETYKPVTLFLEKAQLMWQKGDQTKAFKLLEENIERLELACSGNIRTLDVSERHIYAEAKFLQASYNAEAMNICPELNLRYFEQALSGNRGSEKCLVHLAQYQEKVFNSYSSEQKDSESGARLQLEIMLNYAKSLKYGHTHVYQSLPRLLSIWLDFSSQLMATSSNQAAEISSMSSTSSGKLTGLHEVGRKMNDLITNCNSMLPSAIFYTALSQLLSRICHPSNDVYSNIRNIVVKLIQQFPQQSLWMLLPVFKSCHALRIKRCRSIFTDARLNNPDFQKLFTDFNMLAERLIELTNKEVVYDQSYRLSSLVRQLPRLFQDPNFSEIMLPFEKYMQATFPISSATGYGLSTNLLNKSGTPPSNIFSPNSAFPHKAIYIRGIDEEVVVLRSAAKPKKISIQCSDGHTYNVMVKPKDDLRKDFRLMEFNGLVKRYLHQDSQARYRRLRIRTYAAIPFNEECGLVEWLPRLNSFRGICMAIYRMRGLGIADRLLKQCALPKTDPLEKKRSVFNDILLPRHPPVFHEWFRQQFPTPNSWYQARMAYVKTIAVMSMVGYILGLGDRHGENILFDEMNGDAVHVDFNCLFNQGECFAYPEIVPFRLTHNMVFAMGPLGVEGLFRKCCEITLRVLKDEKRTLMSVLRPFVYDLSSLQRSKVKTTTLASLEMTDPKAMLDVKRIEERLKGYVKKTLGNSMPLSTEGQVNFLINEAIDIDNLAAMYIGWGAFI